MSFQDMKKKGSQKKGESGGPITWEAYAVKELVILEGLIQEIVKRKDRVPHQLLEVAKAVLKTSSSISSIKSCKEDFERLLGNASTLVVIFWRSYNEDDAKYPSLVWPPPKARSLFEELVDTVGCFQKFMERKCEKNVAKRILVGCFGIRDLGKFDKYQRRLHAVASSLESKPYWIKIHPILLEVVNSRTQLQDEDTKRSEALVEGNSPVKRSAKAAAVESSRLRQVGKSITTKPAYDSESVEFEDAEKDSEREQLSDGASRVIPWRQTMEPNEDEDNLNFNHERVEEHSAEDQPARRRIAKRTSLDEEAQENQYERKTLRYEDPEEEHSEEGTSTQGARPNNACQSKARKRRSQEYDRAYDEENNRHRTPKRRGRRRTIPVFPQTPAPPMHYFNNGAGTMINENVGNIHNSTVLNVNDALHKRGDWYR